MTQNTTVFHRSVLLQKRKEILKFKGLFDCSTAKYPKNPKAGDFYICGITAAPPSVIFHTMQDGQIFEYGDYLIYNGTTWDRVK